MYLRQVPREHSLGRNETCPPTTQPMWQGHIQATREPRDHSLQATRRSWVSRALSSTRKRCSSQKTAAVPRGRPEPKAPAMWGGGHTAGLTAGLLGGSPASASSIPGPIFLHLVQLPATRPVPQTGRPSSRALGQDRPKEAWRDADHRPQLAGDRGAGLPACIWDSGVPGGPSPCVEPLQASLSVQAVTVSVHWTRAFREENAADGCPSRKGSP